MTLNPTNLESLFTIADNHAYGTMLLSIDGRSLAKDHPMYGYGSRRVMVSADLAEWITNNMVYTNLNDYYAKAVPVDGVWRIFVMYQTILGSRKLAEISDGEFVAYFATTAGHKSGQEAE